LSVVYTYTHIMLCAAAVHTRSLLQVVAVPDRAKCKGAGAAAIVDLVGFREDNVLPVASFYGRGDTAINHLADLVYDPTAAVREATAKLVGSWLSELPDRCAAYCLLLC
jgi:hypothetical protein